MTPGRIVVVVLGAGIFWVLAGRWLTLIADSVWTKRVEVRKLTAISVARGSIHIGDLVLEGDSDLAATARAGKMELVREGRRFVLGSAKEVGIDEYDVIPETGDAASLEISSSLLSWPTPFEFNFMTGVSPSWKAYRYYRLSWKKRGGETLRATWRYESWFYPANGWSSGLMTSPGVTGLRGMQF
jgi:hypothetical protein